MPIRPSRGRADYCPQCRLQPSRRRSRLKIATRCPADPVEQDPGAVIRPEPGEWYPRMPERLDDEELADWRAGRNAVYQLAALTVGARLAVADA
jgi:hypothetical protein